MRFKKVYIEITNVCNLNCNFCIKNKREQAFMELDDFHHILRELQPYTNYIYLHVLGEPLLHPRLDEFLQSAQKMHMNVNITSNGTLLKQNVEQLKGVVRQLNLSLHSFPKQVGIHEEEYIEDCLRYGDELAEQGTYISYRLWNKKDGCFDEESKKILNQIERHYQVKLEDREKQKLAERRFLHYEEVFRWPSLKAPEEDREGTCYGMRSMCAILVDGSVVPCCLDSGGDCCLGNIFEETLEEILEKPRTTTMLEGFQNHKVIEPLCRRCAYRTRFTIGGTK